MSGLPVWQEALREQASAYWQRKGEIHKLQRLLAGASAETWQFDFVTEMRRFPCIYRRDAVQVSAAMSLCISKSLEFDIVSAALAAGVPVAAPYFEFDSGYVMQCLQGEALPRRILRDEKFADARSALIDHCAKALARIHSIESHAIAGHSLEATADLPEYSATTQLAELECLLRDYDVALPVFEVAFRWLKENTPAQNETTVVHGDFRNGNLMINEAGLHGVLDWELAHRGNPAEDLGWLCVNAWRFGNTELPVGGFGQREALLDAYARYSGRTISSEQLHYWEVFGTLRWGIICLYQVFSHLRGVQISLELAAIGRRIAEVEMDLLMLLAPKHLLNETTSHV